MEALIPGMLIWICLQIGCEPPPPPAVLFVPQEVMDERVYEEGDHGGTFACGLYYHETQSIWLPDDCRVDDLFHQSTLLHELVHHVQTVTGMEYPCLAAREPLAYDLQAQWLQEQGVEDPYAMLGVDKFTILIRSICWPEE
jgi:hypothetical protein